MQRIETLECSSDLFTTDQACVHSWKQSRDPESKEHMCSWCNNYATTHLQIESPVWKKGANNNRDTQLASKMKLSTIHKITQAQNMIPQNQNSCYRILLISCYKTILFSIVHFEKLQDFSQPPQQTIPLDRIESKRQWFSISIDCLKIVFCLIEVKFSLSYSELSFFLLLKLTLIDKNAAQLLLVSIRMDLQLNEWSWRGMYFGVRTLKLSTIFLTTNQQEEAQRGFTVTTRQFSWNLAPETFPLMAVGSTTLRRWSPASTSSSDPPLHCTPQCSWKNW